MLVAGCSPYQGNDFFFVPLKQFLCGVLQQLYASILVGNCPCHSFGKLSGHTGGFYHVVCRHGVSVNQPENIEIVVTFQYKTKTLRELQLLFIFSIFNNTLISCLETQPLINSNDLPCGGYSLLLYYM